MLLCDSSKTYARAVWLLPSPADLRPGLAVGVSEVSRFSCMKFLGVSGVFDYAGLSRCSRYRACSCCLPRITKTSASGFHLFGAEYPPRLSPVYASLCPSRWQCKTRGRADRYSFLVRLFHPLLHAGLSRRTEMAMFRQQRDWAQIPRLFGLDCELLRVQTFVNCWLPRIAS